MLNAVRSNLFGDTGIFLQNFGNALSISSFMISISPSLDVDDADVDVDKFLWNKIKMANATR